MTPALDKWRKEISGRYPKEPEPAPVPLGTIYQRKKRLVPTEGSQRRCYNGCFPSSDWKTVIGDWEVFSVNCKESSLTYWQELTDYAVSQRGEGARSFYKWEPNP